MNSFKTAHRTFLIKMILITRIIVLSENENIFISEMFYILSYYAIHFAEK